MNKILFALALTLTLGLFSCGQEKEGPELPEGYNMIIVKEIEDADRYSYIKTDLDGDEIWTAATRIKAEKGDTLYYSQSYGMNNFNSKSLNKTFDTIIFIEDISNQLPTEQKVDMQHPEVKADVQEDIDVEKAEGGYTVAEIFEKSGELKGETVKIRGVVTKFNANILGKNWIHIQDGSKHKENYDLTITSQDQVKVGDKITVQGTLATDKDFGAGYEYSVIVEDAKVVDGKSDDQMM